MGEAERRERFSRKTLFGWVVWRPSRWHVVDFVLLFVLSLCPPSMKQGLGASMAAITRWPMNGRRPGRCAVCTTCTWVVSRLRTIPSLCSERAFASCRNTTRRQARPLDRVARQSHCQVLRPTDPESVMGNSVARVDTRHRRSTARGSRPFRCGSRLSLALASQALSRLPSGHFQPQYSRASTDAGFGGGCRPLAGSGRR